MTKISKVSPFSTTVELVFFAAQNFFFIFFIGILQFLSGLVGRRVFLYGKKPGHYGDFFVYGEFFCQTTEYIRSGHFLHNYKLLDRQPEKHPSAKGPPFIYAIFNVRYETGRDYRGPS